MKISKLDDLERAQECAHIMANSDPWKTLGRTYEDSLMILRDESKEAYAATENDELIGFVILNMRGAFVGYIQTVCVAPDWRGKGFGSLLIDFAEQYILSQHPNVFMCVSSFNTEAQKLYKRLGYEVIGEIKDYIVSGYSEVLLRKTTGPLTEFKKSRDAESLLSKT